MEHKVIITSKILDKQDSIYAAKVDEILKDFNRIDDYFRARKIERKEMSASLPAHVT